MEMGFVDWKEKLGDHKLVQELLDASLKRVSWFEV
jgi:hypothetical protein